MKGAYVTWLFLLVSASVARADDDDRGSVEAGLFGGAAAIADRNEWGEARYGIVGESVRYERGYRRGYFGVSATHATERRYALDEPSFEQFGWTTARFAAIYVGGLAGFDSRYFGFDATVGLMIGLPASRDRDVLPYGSASIAFRVGRLDRAAFVARFGSTDAWLSDRNVVGHFIVHDGPRVLAAFGGMFALSMAPALLADSEEGPRIAPGRSNFGIVAGPEVLAFRATLGGRFGPNLVGAELTFFQQLPVGRIFLRRSFGEPAARP